MLNRIKLFIVLILLGGVSMNISAQESKDENSSLVWKPVPKIKNYQLQVRDSSKKVIVDKKLKETSYTLDLEPGNYEHRVGAYNKFNKISAYTEWVPFSISKSVVPEVTSEKITGSKSDSSISVKIKGKNFTPKIKVSLKNASNSVPITSVNLPDENTIEMVLNNKDAEPGEYDLILENPKKKIRKVEKFYILNPEKTAVKDEPKTVETKSEETKETKTVETKSEETKETKTVETKPEETKETKTVETKPEEAKQAKTVETKPEETKETKTVETKPEETKETKTVETKPEETKETKTVETKPEETKEAKEGVVKTPITYPYWKNAAMSIVLPGWGQYSKGEIIKSISIGSSLLLALIYYNASYQSFQADKRKYDSSVNQFFILSQAAGQDQLIYPGYMVSENYFLKAENSSNKVYQASIVTGVIYLINILDALFWKVQPKAPEASEKGLHPFTNIYNYSFNSVNSQQSQVEIGLRFRF